jgi:hypothetical protein
MKLNKEKAKDFLTKIQIAAQKAHSIMFGRMQN